MRIAVLQPSFIPWLGYFDQMARADLFVYLDDVQFTRRDWRNRNKIRTANGWMWLTVPVCNKGRFKQSLKDTRIDNALPWKKKHLNALRHNYGQAPCFDLYFPGFESIYQKEWNFLIDLCFESMEWFRAMLRLDTPTCRASELPVAGQKGSRILELCRCLGADRYLTGDLARDYLEPERLAREGIQVEFQRYQHPKYRQQGPGFIAYLSILDLLFNEGPRSLDILTMPETALEETLPGVSA